MAKGVPVCLLLLVDTMMAVRSPVELDDGVSASSLELNRTIVPDADDWDVFQEMLDEIEKLKSMPPRLNAAVISNWMYYLEKWPNRGWRGWTLQAKYAASGDDVALFKSSSGQCVLAFKGTEFELSHFNQVMSNFEWWGTEGEEKGKITAYKCGLGSGPEWKDQEVHTGYWGDMKQFLLKSRGWEPANHWCRRRRRRSRLPKLDSNNIPMSDIQKCSQLEVTGHSKGGAMASIYAACANGFFFNRTWRHVDSLYTFGAPAIALRAPHPGSLDDNEVFQGYRVFNMDNEGNHDVVAAAMTWGRSFKHPKMPALALTGDKGVEELSTDNSSTFSEPKFKEYFWNYFTRTTLSRLKSLHAMNSYLKKLIDLASG